MLWSFLQRFFRDGLFTDTDSQFSARFAGDSMQVISGSFGNVPGFEEVRVLGVEYINNAQSLEFVVYSGDINNQSSLEEREALANPHYNSNSKGYFKPPVSRQAQESMWDCAIDGGETFQASVFSSPSWAIGSYGEDRSNWHASPSLRIGCLVPRGLIQNTLTKDSTTGVMSVSLTARNTPVSVRASVEFRNTTSTEKHDANVIGACTQPLYNASYLENKYPGGVHQWISYHLDLGIDFFNLYDLDGSFAPYLKEFGDRVRYFPNWARSISPAVDTLVSQGKCMYCSEFLAYDHCLYQIKSQDVDWFFTLHAPDAYIRVPANDSLKQLVARQHPSVLNLIFKSIAFYSCDGSANNNADTLPAQFVCRDEELGDATNLGEPLARVKHALYNDRHAAKPRHPGRYKTLGLDPAKWRMHHYRDTFEQRHQQCSSDSGSCPVQVRDTSIADLITPTTSSITPTPEATMR